MAGITGKANSKTLTLAEQALLELVASKLELKDLTGICIWGYPAGGAAGQALDIVFWETSDHSTNPPKNCYVLAVYTGGQGTKLNFGHRDSKGVYKQLWTL